MCIRDSWYTDAGYSGANFQRPGFQAMLADIEAGKVGTVIVKDMSRLGPVSYTHLAPPLTAPPAFADRQSRGDSKECCRPALLLSLIHISEKP